MNENYVSLHGHDYYSNLSMIECIDSPEAWAKSISELGQKAMCISNHGTVLGWYNRYKMAKKYGLKYIHASEIYVTETLDEKKKDNWHVLVIAKNFEGFKELNTLTSNATKRDNHYYYAPRVTLDELMNTSDNLYVFSGCLGGIMYKTYKLEDKVLYTKVLQWFINNKHRTFLEVQPHRDLTQILWNKKLKELSKEHGIKLVGTGDFHAVSKESDETRAILKKSKKIAFEGEDAFSLYLKSYDEIFSQFMAQDIWEEDEVEKLLEETSLIADSVEQFEIDKSIKYPKMYEDSEDRLINLIKNGIKERGIDNLPVEQKKVYAERIAYELDTIKKLGCADYLLLEDSVKSYAREKGIRYGSARGSASGSVITYLTRITNIDPIRENLSFERFLNPERIGIADIDTDFDVDRRIEIQQFLLNHPTLDCAHIVAFGTLQLKGAIKDIGRGLEMPLSLTEEISSGVEDNEQYYRDKYLELFKHVDRVIGCVVSMSVHPCGIIVSDRDLNSEIGTFTVINKETGEPVRATAIDMNEIDEQQWTKLDILALDSITILSETCNLIGIDYESIMPTNIDNNDWNVWSSIRDNSVGVFQFEGSFAHQIYKDLFSDETISKIKKENPNVSYTDLFSLANAILRPSGASYREDVSLGNYFDNGHPALNEFLKETLGRIAYQEQQNQFLVKFCGYTGGQADLVRKGVAKKKPEILDVEIPKIKVALIESLVKNYGIEQREAERIAEPFIQVFIDSAGYSFSRNHSIPYSYLGYACAWLRYYYPLEFLTASLNVNIGKEDKTTRLIEYAKSKGIKINPIKFRYSRSGYMFDKETDSIYQGIHPVKFLNAQVAEGLYELRDVKYNTFVDLLLDIKDGAQEIEIDGVDGGKTVMDYREFLLEDISKEDMKHINLMEKTGGIRYRASETVSINSRQMEILISLNYFSEFGKNKKLLNIFQAFEKEYKATHKLKTKKERYAKLLQLETELEDESLSLVEQCTAELEFLGHVETTSEEMPPNIMILVEVDAMKTYTRAKAYQFCTGEVREFKMGSKLYQQVPFEAMDVVQIVSADIKPKNKKIDGRWQAHPTEKEAWLKEIKFIRKGVEVERD